MPLDTLPEMTTANLVQTSDVRSTMQHRNDIDGLRAVAVLSVLGFHTSLPGLTGGFVGVDIFFVISGYLICGILLRDLKNGQFSISRFYERRCKRILPALIVVLAGCMAASLVILSPMEAKQLGNGAMAAIFSFSNVQFYLQGSYFDQGGALNPLLMTWSLAVEEQFYLCFPLLLLATYKYARKHLFAVLAVGCFLSLAFSIFCEFRHAEFNFYMPFTRAWELGAGSLLALWQTSRRTRTALPLWLLELAGGAGLLALFGCVVFYTPATRFPGYEALPPVLATVLLLLAEGSVANRLLGLRPFRAVGQISYSLYLWHWPLLSFAAIATSGRTPPSARAALMLAALVAATLSYFFVETPFRKAKSYSTPRVLAQYALAMTVIFLCGLSVSKTNGFGLRVPHLANVESEAGIDDPHPCLVPADREPRLDALCVPPPNSKDAVAVLGDSHADSIEATVREQVEKAGQPLVVIASYSCPAVSGVTRLIPAKPQFAASCTRFNAQAMRIIANRPDIKTVYLAGSWPMVKDDYFVPADFLGSAAQVMPGSSAANLVAGVEAEVRALEAEGKHVVLIDDWPSVDFVPLDRVKYQELPARRNFRDALLGRGSQSDPSESVPRAETITPNGELTAAALKEFAAKEPNTRFVDSKAIMCPSNRCLLAAGDRLFYADGNHVSHFGAELILGSGSGSVP